MEIYLPVTGKILSRDSYWETRLNPETNRYEKDCVHTMRVEYTVNGRVYTHNFVGADVRGEEGGDYDLLYRADDPNVVRSAVNETQSRFCRIGRWLPLILAAAAVLLLLALLAGKPG